MSSNGLRKLVCHYVPVGNSYSRLFSLQPFLVLVSNILLFRNEDVLREFVQALPIFRLLVLQINGYISDDLKQGIHSSINICLSRIS